jgi:branched-subunit amino acid ABC-type transport system permease component
MQSLIPSLDADERPRGVAAVCGLLILTAATAFAFAGLLAVHAIPLSYGSVLLQGGLEQSGPIAFVIYGALTLALTWALWTRHRWARRLTILLAAIGVALAVPAISSAVADGRISAMAREGLQIMVRVAVIFYLSQEPVQEWFATRRP